MIGYYNSSADIIVMLDNSWSIGKIGYSHQREFLIRFIERIGTFQSYIVAKCLDDCIEIFKAFPRSSYL